MGSQSPDYPPAGFSLRSVAAKPGAQQTPRSLARPAHLLIYWFSLKQMDTNRKFTSHKPRPYCSSYSKPYTISQTHGAGKNDRPPPPPANTTDPALGAPSSTPAPHPQRTTAPVWRSPPPRGLLLRRVTPTRGWHRCHVCELHVSDSATARQRRLPARWAAGPPPPLQGAPPPVPSVPQLPKRVLRRDAPSPAPSSSPSETHLEPSRGLTGRPTPHAGRRAADEARRRRPALGPASPARMRRPVCQDASQHRRPTFRRRLSHRHVRANRDASASSAPVLLGLQARCPWPGPRTLQAGCSAQLGSRTG